MIQNDIEQLLNPLIVDLGYELWGCEYLSQGKHSVLRLYIDKENGIELADCERVSRQVSALLDVEDPISGNYSLEVSSPGVPRPLFKKEQYKRYIAHEVAIKLFNPINGSRRLSGHIVVANEDSVVLEMDGVQLEIPFSHIVKAKLTSE